MPAVAFDAEVADCLKGRSVGTELVFRNGILIFSSLADLNTQASPPGIGKLSQAHFFMGMSSRKCVIILSPILLAEPIAWDVLMWIAISDEAA
jgi:hypothetical protein